MGAAIGAGMGMGMGARMGQQGPWGGQPPAPPPQTEPLWHVAEAGAAKGPFGKAHLSRLAAEGAFTRDTLVWAPGQDGWKAAGDIPDLARIFTVQPPPIPSPPPAAKG